jgi:hypothetical protein
MSFTAVRGRILFRLIFVSTSGASRANASRMPLPLRADASSASM